MTRRAIGLVCVAMLLAAGPVGAQVDLIETFNNSPAGPTDFLNLDMSNPDNETVYLYSLWTWGGYNTWPYTGVPPDDIWSPITHNQQWGGVVQFQNGAKAGSYMYTRFDDHVFIDASAGGSIRVTLQMTFETQDWAFLIRDNSGWWQSNSVTMPNLGGWVWTQVDTAISGLTWNRVVSAAAADMDELDDGGEQAITLGAAGSPNLSHIEGLGTIAMTDGSSQWTISEMGFVGIEPDYFVPATGLLGLLGLAAAVSSVGGVVLIRRRKR